MEQKSCSCGKFERIEGAGVNAYIAGFLKRDETKQNRFICGSCKSLWEKRLPGDANDKARASLIKINQIK
jgi:hypothetical protein